MGCDGITTHRRVRSPTTFRLSILSEPTQMKVGVPGAWRLLARVMVRAVLADTFPTSLGTRDLLPDWDLPIRGIRRPLFVQDTASSLLRRSIPAGGAAWRSRDSI